MDIPTAKQLCEVASISPSYAHMILSGERKPSRPLAMHILRATGWRHTSIAKLSDDQIAMLETVEPWKPRASPSSDRKAA